MLAYAVLLGVAGVYLTLLLHMILWVVWMMLGIVMLLPSGGMHSASFYPYTRLSFSVVSGLTPSVFS